MTLRAAVLAAALATTTVACHEASDHAVDPAAEAAAEAKVDTSVTVDQLAGWLDAGQCKAVDANNAGTRHHMGTIPGAILLSQYRTYGLDELPADHATKLVFFCANEQCGASHAAAGRAVLAGYRDVHVYTGGIAGWHRAGKPTRSVAL
jgi:rhodanese-related sulfurtransferase